jgi:hypothetical protein
VLRVLDDLIHVRRRNDEVAGRGVERDPGEVDRAAEERIACVPTWDRRWVLAENLCEGLVPGEDRRVVRDPVQPAQDLESILIGEGRGAEEALSSLVPQSAR